MGNDADETIPISVRLGAVVPPEDPEDWTRPFTWIVALGMLIAPLVAVAWFWLAPPDSGAEPLIGTWALAAALVVGAATVGSTQIGRLRAFTGTLGSALFAALVTVAAGLVAAGERQMGVASPTLAQAFAGAGAGLIGATAASAIAPLLAGLSSRWLRVALPAALGTAVAVAVLASFFAGTL